MPEANNMSGLLVEGCTSNMCSPGTNTGVSPLLGRVPRPGGVGKVTSAVFPLGDQSGPCMSAHVSSIFFPMLQSWCSEKLHTREPGLEAQGVGGTLGHAVRIEKLPRRAGRSHTCGIKGK